MTVKDGEGYLPVTGGTVWYKTAGVHTHGTPLLVIHGGPGASHDYLEPLEELADERPVIFYDQLGCGNSDRPADPSLWTLERFVEELHQVREGLGLRKVHLLGQSWGASLAVEYMLTRPPCGVVSLLLSGPLLSTSRWIEDQKAYISALPEEIQAIIGKSEASADFTSPDYQYTIMEFYKRHVCRLAVWPPCLNRTFEKINIPLYMSMWGPSEFTVTGSLNQFERADRLNEISVPVLFTCGSWDEASPATTQYYQRQLPGSDIRIFENASHEHHLEVTEDYLNTARAFFQNTERSFPS